MRGEHEWAAALEKGGQSGKTRLWNFWNAAVGGPDQLLAELGTDVLTPQAPRLGGANRRALAGAYKPRPYLAAVVTCKVAWQPPRGRPWSWEWWLT